jgi:hypothetical protein
MAASTEQVTTELPLNLHRSRQASGRLAARAAQTGRDVAEYASKLLERAVNGLAADEALAAFRRQVARSGLSDDQLDDLFRGGMAQVRADRQAGRAAS